MFVIFSFHSFFRLFPLCLNVTGHILYEPHLIWKLVIEFSKPLGSKVFRNHPTRIGSKKNKCHSRPIRVLTELIDINNFDFLTRMHSSRMRTARTLTGWRTPPGWRTPQDGEPPPDGEPSPGWRTPPPDGELPPVDRQTPVKS